MPRTPPEVRTELVEAQPLVDRAAAGSSSADKESADSAAAAKEHKIEVDYQVGVEPSGH